MKKETKKVIEKLIDPKTNFCNEEDHGLITFLMVWLLEGYSEAIKHPYVLSWIKKLKTGGFVGSKNRLYFDPNDGDIGIAMLMNGAKGYIRQVHK